ncbi:O-antigen polymerase [Neobacillus sp. PS3-34]|uniref:O-antigen polymerase n=1 Tax=Neobacillus sp. PS3-34 TaxID=3070678 RepID=UPI0027E1C4A9|nr:O-antigen polymerase [Neobacillus sp. PS3-34]WML46680.1 O-antigen polymerase [Neobacillus sp. PS3-34]
MEQIGVSIISLIILALSFYFFKVANGTLSINRLTPLSLIFYYNLVLLAYIGSYLMYIGIRVHTDLHLVQDDSYYLITFLSVSYVLLSLPLFIIIFNKIWKVKPEEAFIKYLERPLISLFTKNDKYLYYPLWVITLTSCVVMVYLLKDSPLLNFILGKNTNILEARVIYTRNYSGSLIIKNTIGNAFIPLCSYITYSYMKMFPNKKWKLMFIILFTNSLLIYGTSMSKSGISTYILSFVLLKVLIEGKISLKKLTYISLIVITFVIVMYMVVYQDNQEIITDKETFFFKSGPIGRIIFGQLVGFVNTLYIFPQLHPFVNGGDIAFLRFLGFDFLDSSRIVMSYVSPGAVENGNANVMNSIFIAEAYANFGYLGILFAPLIVAFILHFFTLLLYKLPKTPIVLGWWIYVMFLLSNGIGGGFFSEFLFNTKIIGVSILTILLYISGHVLFTIYDKGYNRLVKN